MTARTIGTSATYLTFHLDGTPKHGQTDRTDFVPGEALLFRALPNTKYT